MAPDLARMQRLRQHGPALLLAIILVGSLSLTATLSVRSRDLRAEVRTLRQRERSPHRGMWMPPVTSASLAGDSVTIGTARPGHLQVLYYFTSTCGFCRETAPVWDSLARSLLSSDSLTDVRWVSLDSNANTARWAREHSIPAERVVFLRGDAPRRWHRALAVPQTVVVDSVGRVLYAFNGSLQRVGSLDSLRILLSARDSSKRSSIAGTLKQAATR
jgi:hypothetical protein